MSLSRMLMVCFSSMLLLAVACAPANDGNGADQEDDEVIVQQEGLGGTPTEVCDAIDVREPDTRQYSEPENVLEPDTDYRAIFCTGVGAVYVDLFEEFTPTTVNNFVFLAQQGYYNNTTFHRVLEDFMAQGGDPTGTGTGTPGYRFEDEFVGFLHFDRPGLLAMANSGQPVTNGSQFFITTSTPEYLNYRHTIFGEVLEGQDLVENIRLRDPQRDSDFEGTSLNTVVVIDEPQLIDTSYVAPVRSQREDVIALLDDDLSIPGLDSFEIEYARELQETDAYEELRTTHDYQYGIEVRHISEDCDILEVPFVETGLQLLAFPSSSNAENALDAVVLSSLGIEGSLDYEQLSSSNFPHPVYIADTVACEANVVHATTRWQRGRYVLIVDVYLLADEKEQADLWLQQVVGWRIYENMLTDILRKEIGHLSG